MREHWEEDDQSESGTRTQTRKRTRKSVTQVHGPNNFPLAKIKKRTSRLLPVDQPGTFIGEHIQDLFKKDGNYQYIRFGVIGEGRCFFHALLATRHPNLPTQFGGQAPGDEWIYGNAIYLELPWKNRREMADELRAYLAVAFEEELVVLEDSVRDSIPRRFHMEDDEIITEMGPKIFQEVERLLRARRRLQKSRNRAYEKERKVTKKVQDLDTQIEELNPAIRGIFAALQNSQQQWLRNFCEYTKGQVLDSIEFLINDLFMPEEEVGQEGPSIIYAFFQIPIIFILPGQDDADEELQVQSDVVDCFASGTLFDLQNLGQNDRVCLITLSGEVHFEPIFKVNINAGGIPHIIDYTHTGDSVIIRRIKADCAKLLAPASAPVANLPPSIPWYCAPDSHDCLQWEGDPIEFGLLNTPFKTEAQCMSYCKDH